MIAILLEAWKLIVSIGSLFARFFPFLARFFGRFGGWIAGVSLWLKEFFGINFAKAAKAAYDNGTVIAMETMVMVAWSWLLTFAASYFSGTGIKAVVTQNPFEGIPRDVMALVAAAFPVHFAVGLITGYIVFRATLPFAALHTIRFVRWIFGA